MEGLLAILGTIPDHRADKGKLHNLAEIIIMSLYGLLCGAVTWLDIQEICEAREVELLIIYFIFKHILLAQNRPESDADGSEVTESLSVIPSQVLSNWKIPDSSSLPFSDNSKLLHPDSNQENTREYVPAKHDHLLLQAKTF